MGLMQADGTHGAEISLHQEQNSLRNNCSNVSTSSNLTHSNIDNPDSSIYQAPENLQGPSMCHVLSDGTQRTQISLCQEQNSLRNNCSSVSTSSNLDNINNDNPEFEEYENIMDEYQNYDSEDHSDSVELLENDGNDINMDENNQDGDNDHNLDELNELDTDSLIHSMVYDRALGHLQ